MESTNYLKWGVRNVPDLQLFIIATTVTMLKYD